MFSLLRARTVMWGASAAIAYKLTRPYVTAYQGVVNKEPFKGYNLLIEQPSIKYLTFEGGGAKGVAYLGAMERLQQEEMLGNVEEVAGSSAGAMQAMLFGLGYSVSEMRVILFQTNMNDFLDICTGQEDMNWIQKGWRAALNISTKTDKSGRGLYEGNVLKDWLKQRIADRVAALHKASTGTQKDYLKTLLDKNGELTFSELEELKAKVPEANVKTIHFTGSNYTSQKLEVFNPTNTPDMPVYMAARISASFPWAFKSVMYNNSEYIDGGALNNYPMQIFDNPDNEKYCIGKDGANLEALGIRVDSHREILDILWRTPGPEATGFLSSFKKSLGKFFVGVDFITAGSSTDRATYEKYPHRTIQIFDEAYSTLNFDLSEQDKLKLVESGRSATGNYLENYFAGGTALSIKVEKLEDLSDYFSKDTLADAANRFAAEMYVQTDLPAFMNDLPFDYFAGEIQTAIEQATRQLIEENPLQSTEILSQKVMPAVQEKLYQLLESSLKGQFNTALTKGGYDPAKFPEVIFDVLQFTGPDAPISRAMTNIVNVVDTQGNSFMDNVINSEVTNSRIHDLSQSADQIQAKISDYDLQIQESQKESKKLELHIASIQEMIDSSQVQEKQSLLDQRAELEQKIDAERARIEERQQARDVSQQEKDKRESPDWSTQKENEQSDYEKQLQRSQESASSQRGEIFQF